MRSTTLTFFRASMACAAATSQTLRAATSSSKETTGASPFQRRLPVDILLLGGGDPADLRRGLCPKGVSASGLTAAEEPAISPRCATRARLPPDPAPRDGGHASQSLAVVSAFYEVLLPLGIRTALAKPVQMTISPIPPAPIRRRSTFTGTTPRPTPTSCSRTSPAPHRSSTTVNRTITINVNHFSTFVMFHTGVAVITGNTFAGGDIEAFNFPNPFDWRQTRMTRDPARKALPTQAR